MRLDFFDLQLFINILSTGSLTKGAERSAISLQAASERIKKLEHHFEVSLFTRHATGVKATLAGQTFAEHAQHLLQQQQQLQQAMLPFAHSTTSNIILWCNSSAQSEYLPHLLPQYLMENPKLHIELKEAETNDIIQALSTGTAQLGLISGFFDAGQLETQEFAEDPLVLICPSQHPLATVAQLELGELLQHPFVGLMQYHSLQQSIEAQAKRLGCDIHYRLRVPNFAAIAQVVANGVGIAVIPKRAALRLKAQYDFQQIELLGKWANRKLLLAARCFDQLPADYQRFSQFLLSQHDQLRPH